MVNYLSRGNRKLASYGFKSYECWKSEEKKMTEEKSNMPDYNVCTPRKDGEKTFWTTIGAGWKKKDGAISISLNALPLGNSIMIFVRTEKKE